MRPLTLTIAFLLLISLTSMSQTQRPDSSNQIRLKTGETIYSHIRLRQNSSAEKYFLLDDDQQLPVEQVDRFSNRRYLFVTVPGSAGTDIYRVEREGPKISLYSKLFIDPNYAGDSGYAPTRNFFFRKPGDEKMRPVTYTSLKNAVIDNPESVHQLDVTRTNTIVGISISGASFLLGVIGLISTIHHHLSAPTLPVITPPTQPGITLPFPTVPPTLPPLPPAPKNPISPLCYIGMGGMIGGFIFAFGSQHHGYKAIDIYNQ